LSDGFACPGSTAGNFPTCVIDHIFVSGDVDWKVHSWVVDMWQYGDEPFFPSDHRSHFVEVSY